MKRILSVFVVMFVMFCSTCFAFSATTGQTTTHNAFRILVEAPSMPNLVYAKMPALHLDYGQSTADRPIK